MAPSFESWNDYPPSSTAKRCRRPEKQQHSASAAGRSRQPPAPCDVWLLVSDLGAAASAATAGPLRIVERGGRAYSRPLGYRPVSRRASDGVEIRARRPRLTGRRAVVGSLAAGQRVADVFISYSRLDGEFVRRLTSALREHGKDVWTDVEGIRDAEVFPEVLRRAIESSDTFAFLISPGSVRSSFCAEEIEHAATSA